MWGQVILCPGRRWPTEPRLQGRNPALPQPTVPGHGIEPPAPTSHTPKGVCSKNPSQRDQPPVPHSTWQRPDSAGPYSKIEKTGTFWGAARSHRISALALSLRALREGMSITTHAVVWASTALWPQPRSIPTPINASRHMCTYWFTDNSQDHTLQVRQSTQSLCSPSRTDRKVPVRAIIYICYKLNSASTGRGGMLS